MLPPRRSLLVLSVAAAYLAWASAFVLPAGPRQVVRPVYSTKAAAPAETPRDPDEIIVEGDFEDDTIKPSLSSLLEDGPLDGVDDLDTLRALDADADDGFFGIPDYVPSELPDLAALGAGLERKRESGVGGYDVDNEEMYKELELDQLDEKLKEYTIENPDEPGEPYKLWVAKKEATTQWRIHDKDVGSSAVQVAQLTLTIQHLTKHIQSNPRDHSTRRGLIAAVNARRRHLNYVYRRDPAKGREMAAAFGIRFKAPDEVRSKFEMYRNFRNTKSKKAKNLQAVEEARKAGVA